MMHGPINIRQYMLFMSVYVRHQFHVTADDTYVGQPKYTVFNILQSVTQRNIPANFWGGRDNSDLCALNPEAT